MKLCAECQCKDCRARRDAARGAQGIDYWMPEPGECIAVPGMSGTGKSTWGKGLMAFLAEQGVTQYGWDPSREMSEHGIERETQPLGPMKYQATVSELEDRPELLEELAGASLAIVPDDKYPGRKERADDFCRGMRLLLPNKPKGLVVVHIEECGLLEDEAEAETLLVEIATTWRKEGAAVVFYMQSISQLPSLARKGLRTVVAHAQRDRYDRQALSDLVSPRYARAVMKLQKFQCLYANRMDGDAWADDGGPEETGADDAVSAA